MEIAVDVDGTLILGDAVNQALVDWCKAQARDGHRLTVWSARGEEYAAAAVAKCGLSDIVVHAISKPQVIVDDKLWQWTERTFAMRAVTIGKC